MKVKITNRVLSLFLACLLVTGLFTANVSAANVIKTLSVKQITESTAYITGSYGTDDGASFNPSIVGFAYSKSQNDSQPFHGEAVKQGDGTFTANLGRLEPNTIYYVKAYALISSGGNDAYLYGNIIEFTTEGGEDYPVVTTTSGTYVGDGIITVYGSVTTDSKATACGFVYSEENPSPTLKDKIAKVGSTNGTYSASININTEYKTHYVRAYATNDAGTSYGKSIEVSLTGKKPVVETVKFSDITGSTAVIHLNISEEGDSPLEEMGIVYSKSVAIPTFTSSDTKIIRNTGKTGRSTIELTDLEPQTVYYARAWADNESGAGFGTVISFTTGELEEATLDINYVSTSGKTIDTQKLVVKGGRILEPRHISLPKNYTMANPDWTYRVRSNDTLYINVIPLESAYMAGIGNFNFGPDQSATRQQIAQVLYELSVDKDASEGMQFPDVNAGSSYKAAIDFVSAKGYMTGDNNGRFNPTSNITRAEMATVLCNFYRLNDKSGTSFADVAGHWSQDFVTAAFNSGLLSGYEDNTFRPYNNVTRAEACTMFSKAEKRSLEPLGLSNFSDVPKDAWYYVFIMNASVPMP